MTLVLKAIVVWLLINVVYFWWMVDGRYWLAERQAKSVAANAV